MNDTTSNSNNNNKLIIKTQFVSNELSNNDNANITNLNINKEFFYATRLRTPNEIELLEVEEDEAEAEEISKINVEFKPSISPTYPCSLQLPSLDNISSYSSISSNSSSISAFSTSSSSSSSSSSAKNKNLKSVVFVLNKHSQQQQLTNEHLDKTEMKSSLALADNDELSSLADSSFSSTSLSSTTVVTKATNTDEQITQGKVKHLREKFDESILQSANHFKRRTSDTIKNYQLKKCQSVIFSLDAASSSSSSTNQSTTNKLENCKFNLRSRAQSNNCIGELLTDLDEKMSKNSKMINNGNNCNTNENESLIDESSVFDSCGVKERIRKFNNDFNNSKNETSLKLKRSMNSSVDPLSTVSNKYGGSCNNLNLNNTTNKPTKHLITTVNISSNNNNNMSNNNYTSLINKKLGITDMDTSNNDDSNSTFSDDLTNSDLSYTHDFKQPVLKLNKSLNDNNKENYFDIKLVSNFSSFEENYAKIKQAFSDLKKDNQEISSLLNVVRNKVREASINFYDSFLAQTDEYSNTTSINSTLTLNINNTNEFEAVSEYDDASSLNQELFLNSKLTNDSNQHLYVRHKF